MKFSTKIKSGKLHITIESEYITHQDNLDEFIKTIKEHDGLPIVVDLSNVKSADSALMNMFVIIKKEVNTEITVRNASDEILTLLEVVGLHNIIKIEIFEELQKI